MLGLINGIKNDLEFEELGAEDISSIGFDEECDEGEFQLPCHNDVKSTNQAGLRESENDSSRKSARSMAVLSLLKSITVGKKSEEGTGLLAVSSDSSDSDSDVFPAAEQHNSKDIAATSKDIKIGTTTQKETPGSKWTEIVFGTDKSGDATSDSFFPVLPTSMRNVFEPTFPPAPLVVNVEIEEDGNGNKPRSTRLSMKRRSSRGIGRPRSARGLSLKHPQPQANEPKTSPASNISTRSLRSARPSSRIASTRKVEGSQYHLDTNEMETSPGDKNYRSPRNGRPRLSRGPSMRKSGKSQRHLRTTEEETHTGDNSKSSRRKPRDSRSLLLKRDSQHHLKTSEFQTDSPGSSKKSPGSCPDPNRRRSLVKQRSERKNSGSMRNNSPKVQRDTLKNLALALNPHTTILKEIETLEKLPGPSQNDQDTQELIAGMGEHAGLVRSRRRSSSFGKRRGRKKGDNAPPSNPNSDSSLSPEPVSSGQRTRKSSNMKSRNCPNLKPGSLDKSEKINTEEDNQSVHAQGSSRMLVRRSFSRSDSMSGSQFTKARARAGSPITPRRPLKSTLKRELKGSMQITEIVQTPMRVSCCSNRDEFGSTSAVPRCSNLDESESTSAGSFVVPNKLEIEETVECRVEDCEDSLSADSSEDSFHSLTPIEDLRDAKLSLSRQHSSVLDISSTSAFNRESTPSRSDSVKTLRHGDVSLLPRSSRERRQIVEDALTASIGCLELDDENSMSDSFQSPI